MKQHKYPLATDLQNTPPVPCEFKVGDVVTFTNDYGVKFHDKVVTGFAPSVENGRFGGCKKFCVNGLLAGNCRLAWSRDDRRNETLTHRPD